MDIKESLKLFGLTDKEQEVYWLLAKSGWCTVLVLSRKCQIKRTTLYRILESLVVKGFAEVRVDEMTTYYRVTNPEVLGSRVLEEAKKVDQLQESVRLIQQQLKTVTASGVYRTEVHFHRGVKGIQMMEWRTAQTQNSETLIFATNEWIDLTGREFAEDVMRQERLARSAKIRELANEENYGPIPKSGEVSWTSNKEYLFKIYRHRMIPRSVLPITNEVLIQGDAMYFYGLESDEVVVVEFISPSYVSLMKGLFEMAWKVAKVKDGFGGDR